MPGLTGSWIRPPSAPRPTAARRSAPTTLSSIKRGAGLLTLAFLAACPGAAPRGDLALGDEAFHQGRDEEAAKHYARAVEAARASGSKGPALVQALNSLAAIERIEGRYGKAASIYRESAAILEGVSDPGCPGLCSVYYDLAQTLSLGGRIKEADDAYHRFLELAAKAPGAASEELAVQLVAAGQYFHSQDRFDEALACYRRALAIREKRLSPDSAGLVELRQDIESALKAAKPR